MKMNEQSQSLDNLISQLQGRGLGLTLSRFVKLNLDVLIKIRKLGISLNRQAKIVEEAIGSGKTIAPTSFSVAMSRLTPLKEKRPNNIVIMEKEIIGNFVDSKVKLTLGTQKEKVPGKKDRLIDWRGLNEKESISNWVLEYKDKLIAINQTGWRWKQIAGAISEHLEKDIATNTLTSIICLANKKS